MEAVAAHALVVEELAAAQQQSVCAGCPRWKAVSKQATCGMSGSISAASRIGARLCGWCSGASGASAVSRARMAASMRTGRS